MKGLISLTNGEELPVPSLIISPPSPLGGCACEGAGKKSKRSQVKAVN